MKNIINIDSLKQLTSGMYTKENLKNELMVGQNISISKDSRGRWITEYRHGVQTKIGIIEYSVWLQAIDILANKIGEKDLYEKYKKFFQNDPSPAIARDHVFYAARAYMSDLHLNPKWVRYEEFREN